MHFISFYINELNTFALKSSPQHIKRPSLETGLLFWPLYQNW